MVVSYAIFGDSFAKMFRLIEHERLRVKGYKGITAKGLARPGNSSAGDIQRELRRMRSLQEVMFNFGQVDVYFSYYYKTYKMEEPIDLDDIAREYVRFVAQLDTRARKTIMGIYPSVPHDEYQRTTLCKYAIVDEEVAEKIPDHDISLQVRQERVRRFNRVLKTTCEECGIDFADLFEDLCDMQSVPPRLHDRYRDISECNIHLAWETTMLLWVRDLPWLSSLVPQDFQEKSIASWKEYIKTKPWANKDHISDLLTEFESKPAGKRSQKGISTALDRNWRKIGK